ncbi:MAG: hypothetical protein RI996_328 [Candidatus Parcubacteria bacterium]
MTNIFIFAIICILITLVVCLEGKLQHKKDMKTIFKSFLLVLALIVSANNAYAANSFATKNADGTYTGTLYASISAQADSWIELNKGAGLQQYGRTTRPAGEFSVQVPGLECGKSYPYRLGAINPYTGANFFGETFNLEVRCDGTGGPSTISVTTGSNTSNQTSATLNGSVSASANSWIEINLGNGPVRIGEGTRSGSYSGYVSGLTCNTTYYYRAVAQGSNGVVYGSTQSFTTSACNSGGGNNSISAITTVATGVGYNIARLNGIGLVNTTPTNAYFEWGTNSSSLNNRTQIKTYYESNSVPVLDILTGLSANTTYYYRVVAQNPGGSTAYGQIVSFRTETTPSTTVVSTNTNNTNTTRTVTNTNTSGIVYIPVQLANVGTLTTGVNGSTNVPSFATVGVAKSSANGCENTFTITYTNTSDKLLSNTILSVNLPNELEFVSATDGSFRATDSTLTIPVGTLEARQSKTVTITTKVLSGAQSGKQVAVTAYLNYTEGSSNAQNQVTGYTILTLGDNCSTTVTKTSQAGAAGLFGFLPNNIWQWILVLFAIALIIIAGRSLFGGSKPAAH